MAQTTLGTIVLLTTSSFIPPESRQQDVQMFASIEIEFIETNVFPLSFEQCADPTVEQRWRILAHAIALS